MLKTLGKSPQSGLKTDEELMSHLSKVDIEIKSNYKSFPIEAFSIPEIAECISAWERCQNFSPDYTGAAMIYALSAAIGNVYKIEIKRGFVQPAMVYMVLMGNPGANKSSPLNEAVKPIEKRDEMLDHLYKDQMKAWKLKVAEISRSKDTNIEIPEEPVRRKILINDCTQEAVAFVHKNNLRGIAVRADELAGWFKNFNRYNKGSDQENWLQTWSGGMFNIDRKGTESISIYSPFISVGGTMQPGILHQLIKDDRGENGFVDRLLFAYPDREASAFWNDEEIPFEAQNIWFNTINRVLDLDQQYNEYGHVVSKIVKLSPEAKTILYEWQNRNTIESQSVETKLVGIYRKMDIYLARFALIIQVLRYVSNEANDQVIDTEAAKGAVMLADYFKYNAIKVYEMSIGRDPFAGLGKMQKMIFAQLPNCFNRADVLHVVEESGMHVRTFDRLLKNKKYFKKIKQGAYQKLVG